MSVYIQGGPKSKPLWRITIKSHQNRQCGYISHQFFV